MIEGMDHPPPRLSSISTGFPPPSQPEEEELFLPLLYLPFDEWEE
jgi:hypothetical protein